MFDHKSYQGRVGTDSKHIYTQAVINTPQRYLHKTSKRKISQRSAKSAFVL